MAGGRGFASHGGITLSRGWLCQRWKPLDIPGTHLHSATQLLMGLKFLNPGFFGVGKFGKYCFGETRVSARLRTSDGMMKKQTQTITFYFFIIIICDTSFNAFWKFLKLGFDFHPHSIIPVT